MIKKDKILQSYICNIIDDEKPEKITFITSKDISKLIKRLEKTSISNINVAPAIDMKSIESENCYFYRLY